MKILIFGASGMLGFAIQRVLHDSGYDVTGVSRRADPPSSTWCEGLKYVCNVDVRDCDAVMDILKRVRPEKVINAAAIRKAGETAAQAHDLYVVNSRFPLLLDRASEFLGFHLVQISSDGVFGGSRGMYTEESFPDATDIYGVSKLLGEPSGKRSLVLRTSVLGRALEPNDSLLDWFLCNHKPVRGHRCAFFSGLPANEIARFLAHVVLRRPVPLTGLFNLAASRISKFELLVLFRDAWGLDSVQIEADDIPAIDRSLDPALLQKLVGYVPASWPELVTQMHHFYEHLDKSVSVTPQRSPS